MNINASANRKDSTFPSQYEEFLFDVIKGLSGSPRSLPCKYFYDERGSQLFENICELEEYYLTRTELAIMADSVVEIAQAIGPGADILEFGSGAGVKTRMLLEALKAPRSYTPLDISVEILESSSAALREAYPDLAVCPVLADYTGALPHLEEFSSGMAGKKLVYFPGSTLGNFERAEAGRFLSRIAGLLGPGGGLLIGLDLVKDEVVLNLAYDDPGGVTAEFNKNLLHRINSELQAAIDPGNFRHRAVYNRTLHRIEMYLVSECDQAIEIDGAQFNLVQGDAIHTENSHKYSVPGFRAMAGEYGFDLLGNWIDKQAWFAVMYLEIVPEVGS